MRGNNIFALITTVVIVTITVIISVFIKLMGF